MKILLLGGTGAMGISLVKMLALQNHDVYVTSRQQRESSEKIHYIRGNAHDDVFLDELLKFRFDIIVDFMIYLPDEFTNRIKKILNATGQYMFLSSARVYANLGVAPITECSPRLLDVCQDIKYLETNEYAIAKAREENVLFNFASKNWTIIRPYITYNIERLQLGGIEKDLWLWRALNGLSVPLPKDVAMCKTTLTYGEDVARAIAVLMGINQAKGEVFNITGNEAITWEEVALIYADVIKEETGNTIKLYSPTDSMELSNVMGNEYQIFYDRIYNRVFDNSKIMNICNSAFRFTPVKEGLRSCLKQFIQSPRWGYINVKVEAYLNRKSGEKENLRLLNGKKEIMKYCGHFYAPIFMDKLLSIKNNCNSSKK